MTNASGTCMRHRAGLGAFSIFLAHRVLGHFLARNATGANANAPIHILRRRENAFDFHLSRLFRTLRREIQPFVFVHLAFLFQFFETLLLTLFLLFQIFFVVWAMSPANEPRRRKEINQQFIATAIAGSTYLVDGNTSFRTTRSFNSVKVVLLRF